MDMEDEDSVRLADLIKSGTKRFLYEYDFGDDWRRLITIEKVTPIDTGSKLPDCLDGARACPPEDCGSIPGYEDLVEAFNDDSPADEQEGLVDGVIGGIAEYLGWSSTMLRVICVISGVGIGVYIALMFLMPEPDEFD